MKARGYQPRCLPQIHFFQARQEGRFLNVIRSHRQSTSLRHKSRLRRTPWPTAARLGVGQKCRRETKSSARATTTPPIPRPEAPSVPRRGEWGWKEA